MYCVFCGGTKFERREVTEVIRDRDRILGTVTVQAEVCLQCGEPYFDPEACRHLDEARKHLLQQVTPTTER